MQAYELMREVRGKLPHNARRAQEAAVALRDVFDLLMIDACASFDSALTEILGGALCGSSQQSMVSQWRPALSAIL